MEPDAGFLQTEAVVLITFAVSVFLFLSNFHICGFLGDIASGIMLGVFGSIGYVAPVLLFLGLVFYASNKGNIRAVYKMLAVEVLLIALCGLAQLVFGGGYKEGQTLGEIYSMAGESGLGGGIVGGALVLVLHKALGTIGAYLVLLVTAIISLVCITEKSFVSAIKRGSGKAYEYAREDYGRRKEIREEKKEEKRLLREEQRVQGVNLDSTDLSRGQSPFFSQNNAAVPTDSPYRPEHARMPEASEMNLEEPKTRNNKKKELSREEAEFNAFREEMQSRPDPADIFKGKITMDGQAPEEDSVPFEEDISLSRSHMDEDVFVSRKSCDFDAMDVFGDPSSNAAGTTAAIKEDIPVTKVLETEIPEEKEEEPSAENPEMAGSEIREEEASETAKQSQDYWLDEDYEFRGEEFDAESEFIQESELIPEPESIPESELIPEPELDTEPYVESEDYWKPVAAPDRKRVVTSTGKIIETDAEEIIKKKAEKRRMEAAEKEAANETVLNEIKKTEEKPKKPYMIPPLDLLNKGPEQSGSQSDKEYRETAIKLQQTLRNFGVGVTVTNISCGPTVTRYELHPEQGVKVSKIQSLADDIKLNLAATDIRIEAPIPGKAAVGIEVPNKTNSIVYLRDLLESEEFKKHPSRLAFAVGKDIGGQVIVSDLAKMPHLLIAGQTGSGKSVGINTMIMSLIYRASPDDVKLIMIDPKVVELSVYNGLPHLLIPVVTDPKKAAGALNWAVAEMMERYNKFAQSNVRDLKGYNARIRAMEDAGDVARDQIPAKLPQLVIIIDELADLMMVASGEVEDAICRLAQLARAAGIHLVIATQRPSVNVITGVIKANVPSRIAFSVASGVDSRTILDMNGAEKLLGNGDMLFYPSGYPKPVRVQGAFVSDQEVSRVTDYIKEQNEDTGYNKEIEKKMTLGGTAGGSSGGSDRDSLFMDAGRFIIEKDKASIGMLQRMFKIGFNRAARIMDQLAEAGVVGEEEGTKPRKILMSMEQFEELLESGY